MAIKIEKIDETLPNPAYALEGDAGVDCYSAKSLTIYPGEISVIPLGIKIELPQGKAALVLPKSGLSSKTGLDCVVGLIDSGYRGEVSMIARNNAKQLIEVEKGQKVCQLVFVDMPQEEIVFGTVEQNTVRGANGFGSTGI